MHTVYSQSLGILWFTLTDIKLAIFNLKLSKSPGLDEIVPEIIRYADNPLAVIMMKLFNLCIIHGYVPYSFCHSVTVPVVKDKIGNNDCFDSDRPIFLVTIFSKVFELCLIQRLKLLFNVGELQFDFVSGMNCQKAIFSLETVSNYFTERGISVLMAALDASKVFDRINCFALLNKFIQIGMLLCLINVFLC